MNISLKKGKLTEDLLTEVKSIWGGNSLSPVHKAKDSASNIQSPVRIQIKPASRQKTRPQTATQTSKDVKSRGSKNSLNSSIDTVKLTG